MENNEYMNGALDWDSEIANDGQEFITLEEGDYNFEVTNFERGRFPGSAKITACPKAIVYLSVDSGHGTASAKVELILHQALEWKLSAFFRCIGQKKHGEKLVPNWASVVGSKGRAHFKPETYVNKNGEERTKNELANFIDYDEKFFKKDKKDVKFTAWEAAGSDDLPF